MSKIVRAVTRLITPAILLFGLYVIMHGHVTPGGGFQGGAVVASAIALLIVAFRAEGVERFLKEHSLSVAESGGALMFIGLAFAGLGGAFFLNFLVGSPVFGHIPPAGPNPGDVWTGGTVPLMNIAVGLKVIAGLSAIMLVMAMAATRWGDK
jgi:energy-converting hydrogenase B subunit I